MSDGWISRYFMKLFSTLLNTKRGATLVVKRELSAVLWDCKQCLLFSLVPAALHDLRALLCSGTMLLGGKECLTSLSGARGYRQLVQSLSMDARVCASKKKISAAFLVWEREPSDFVCRICMTDDVGKVNACRENLV